MTNEDARGRMTDGATCPLRGEKGEDKTQDREVTPRGRKHSKKQKRSGVGSKLPGRGEDAPAGGEARGRVIIHDETGGILGPEEEPGGARSGREKKGKEWVLPGLARAPGV